MSVSCAFGVRRREPPPYLPACDEGKDGLCSFRSSNLLEKNRGGGLSLQQKVLAQDNLPKACPRSCPRCQDYGGQNLAQDLA